MKHLLIAILVSVVVFGLTGCVAYEIALELHTQGTKLF